MINFKQKEEQVPSLLILLSIILLAGTLLYMVFVPMPSAAGVSKGREISRKKLESEIADAQTRTQEMTAAVKPMLWQGNDETITSQVLTLLTDQAKQRSLKMSAFRPQKPQSLPGARELSFSVQISGAYPTVQEMVKIFDEPHNKLVLRSVQIASSDSATSAVTATLNLSAYTESTETTVPTRTKTESPHG